MTQSIPKWILAFMLCTGIRGMAQNSSWTNYYESSDILISYSADVQCNYGDPLSNATYIFIKVTNKTSSPITLKYLMEVYYQGEGCVTCNNDEYNYSLKIPANGSVEAGCDYPDKGLSKLAIFKKYTDKPNRRILERFELTHLTVEK